MNKPAENAKRPGLIDYFKHVRLEMKKVIWPTRKELVSYTLVVIFICTVIGLAIWGLDSLFAAGIKLVLNK